MPAGVQGHWKAESRQGLAQDSPRCPSCPLLGGDAPQTRPPAVSESKPWVQHVDRGRGWPSEVHGEARARGGGGGLMAPPPLTAARMGMGGQPSVSPDRPPPEQPGQRAPSRPQPHIQKAEIHPTESLLIPDGAGNGILVRFTGNTVCRSYRIRR